RLTVAFGATVVLGLTTNLRFLRWLIREPAVRDGQMRIDTLGRIWPPDGWSARARTPDSAWQAAGPALARAGWPAGRRLNGAARIRLATGDEERTIALAAGAARAATVAVAHGVAYVDVAGRSVPFRLAPAPDVDRAMRAATGSHGAGPTEIVAPMPGSIV